MSGAGFMRMVKNVGDSISKIGGKKTDTDSVSEETSKLHPTVHLSFPPPSGLRNRSRTMSSWMHTLGNSTQPSRP